MVKIVNALKTSPVSSSIPVSIDASGIAQALKQAQDDYMAALAQQPPVNPAEIVATAGSRMQEIYARYEKLKVLGRALNGLTTTDRIPATVQIDNVAIAFRIKDESGKFGELITADIKNVAFVGDLAGLLSTEIGLIITSLQHEVKTLADVAQKSQEQYSRALKNWEDSNQDRQIKQV
jgi:hypothetical protein